MRWADAKFLGKRIFSLHLAINNNFGIYVKVFISWSGPRSRYLAEALRNWVPKVIQALEPWMSDDDIVSGARWLPEVSTVLSEAKVGILCVTPENQANPWLVFEAGALSKTVEQTFVCPLLYDMTPSQLTGPISQFQAASFDKAGLWRVVTNLNDALKSRSLPARELEEIFEVWWPKLFGKIEETPTLNTEKIARRSTDELLEEVLSLSREQLRRENLRLEHAQARDERLDVVLPFFDEVAIAARDMRKKGINILSLQGTSFPAGISMEVAEKVFATMKEQSEAGKRETQALLAKPLPENDAKTLGE